MAGRSITNESIAAMLQYRNMTPTVLQDLLAAINRLLEDFETYRPNLVQAHVTAYRDILYELRDLLRVIGEDVDETSTRMGARIRQYENIISQRIR